LAHSESKFGKASINHTQGDNSKEQSTTQSPNVKIIASVQKYIKTNPRKSIAFGVFLVWWLVCLPRPLFQVPYSSTVEDTRGQLLSARIASDGQWRMYPSDSIPAKYRTCLIAYEDQWFMWHPGINPVSIGQALVTNIQKGTVRRGGSTITMQTIRMARGNPDRTVLEKLRELLMATRLELTWSKASILRAYVAHAPYGGNIVGLDAASWRYFGVRPHDLSWAQCATLAVLPNSPGLIHPGRNRDALKRKRDLLLKKLTDLGEIDTQTYDLAISEGLPEAPESIPNLTPHLLDRLTNQARREGNARLRFTTQIDAQMQTRAQGALEYYAQIYRGNGVHNLAAVVIRVSDGAVLAYQGNVASKQKEDHPDVDILASARSTGSILKPYLYAMSLQDGLIMPNSLLEDTPLHLNGYKPENYKSTYDGAVPASRALIRSLNVPFVIALSHYGVGKFQTNLQRLGLTTFTKSPNHYGLTLILGGAEANLVELSAAYAGMARTLNFYTQNSSRYSTQNQYDAAHFVQKTAIKTSKKAETRKDTPLLSAGAIYTTFEQMRHLERPDDAGEWEMFQTPRQVGWKTGTSFGFRDAWAIGVTPEYVIGVWVGNADGEGRPGLIGAHTAAPVLFRIVEQLPATTWFDTPFDDMRQASVCKRSGNRANGNCAEVDSTWIPEACLAAAACQHCTILHLNSEGTYQIRAECTSSNQEIVHKPWFSLPPEQEMWFRLRNPWYAAPPPMHPMCTAYAGAQADAQEIQIVYPTQQAKIVLPKELNQQKNKLVMQVSHRRSDAKVHWHLDAQYLGTTTQFHEWAMEIPTGSHTVTAVDEKGQRAVRNFEIVN
jgi:penicillin-binding protein 1C